MAAHGSGKICYIELPATDIERSAEFYRTTFGWSIRRRENGSIAFDDGVGQVSGTWVQDREAARTPGLLVYIMVGDAAVISKAIVTAGGQIVRPVDPGSEVVFAHFRDPAGNILGVYEHRGVPD
ncbi:MAG: VOC family protein [Vulcanimicrobiaceae bacterium]